MDILNVGRVQRVYAFFTRKMSVNQLNIRGFCRCHASINLFWLRKILIVFLATKQYQPFCVRTGGDALIKLQCSGLLPTIEVGLYYLRKWRRGESLLFIYSKHSRCRRVYTAPAALVKTAQQSGKSTRKVAFHHSNFCQGVSSFESFANEVTHFWSFLLSTTYLFSLDSIHFNTGHLHWHSNFFATCFVYFG